MTTPRAVAGFLAAVMILLSSFAHSILGWPAMRARLAETTAPADLVLGLGVGWVFGGVCMLAFGAIVLWAFMRVSKGSTVTLVPLRIIGVAYLLFGLGALWVSGGNPFYAVFVVPALLLLFASFGSDAPLARR
jgi:hypothetical protein